jgi:hypothetical protein
MKFAERAVRCVAHVDAKDADAASNNAARCALRDRAQRREYLGRLRRVSRQSEIVCVQLN